MASKLSFKLINIIILLIPIICQNIINLDEDNYDNEIEASKDFWVIEFYSEKCESCRKFDSMWKILVKKIDYLKIGRINIDEPKGMALANILNALENGIPAIKLIYKNEVNENIMTGDEDPFPRVKVLKKRIDEILKSKGKLEEDL